MHHTDPSRLGSTNTLNRPARKLILALAGSLCLTMTASTFAANNQSLAAAAIQAFDRNHNQRLDTTEYRSLRIRMRDVFDGNGVPSTVILRAAPEFQAIYSAADHDRSVSLTSSESRSAAAVLSALSPAGNRRTNQRSSRVRTSQESRPSSPRSNGLAAMSRQAGTASTTYRAFRTGRASSSSRSMPTVSFRNDLQAGLRAAQVQFDAMRARMQWEAELRRRGIEVSDDVQNPQRQASRDSDRDDSPRRNDSNDDNDGSRSDRSDSSSNDDSTADSESHRDDDRDGDDHEETSSDGSDSSGTDNSSGSSGSGGSGSGTSGVSGHHEEHEGHGEGHHEEHGEHHEDHDGDDDD